MNRKRWKLPKKLDKQWNKPLVSEKRRAKNSFIPGIKETNMPTWKQERTERKSINNIEWFMP